MSETQDNFQEMLKNLAAGGDEALVNLVMESLQPAQARLLRLCAIPHQFDLAIIRVLDATLDPDSVAAIFELFSTLPIIHRAPDALMFHDQVRSQLFNAWLEEPLLSDFVAASQRLFHYYSSVETYDDDDSSPIVLKCIFHQLGFSLREAFDRFERVLRRFRRDFDLGRSEQLINLVREYDRVLPTEYRHRLTYDEGKLAADGQKLNIAERIFKELLSSDCCADELKVKAHRRLAMVYAHQGRWEIAQSEYIQARQVLSRTKGADRLLPLIDQGLAVTYREMGDLDKAEKLLKGSISLAKEWGDRSMAASGLNGLGTLYQKANLIEEARNYFHQSLSLLQELADEYRIAQTYNNLALTYSQTGDWSTSAQLMEKSLAIKQDIGDLVGEARTLNNLTRVYRNLGRLENGRMAASHAFKLFQQVHDFRGMAYSQVNLGEIYGQTGDKLECRLALENAVNLFERGKLHDEASNLRLNIAGYTREFSLPQTN